VKNHRIYLIDADIVSRSGPRIADALEEVTKFIHPELFEMYEVMVHASARA
jgi:iron complex transport system substrate-binding protein